MSDEDFVPPVHEPPIVPKIPEVVLVPVIDILKVWGGKPDNVLWASTIHDAFPDRHANQIDPVLELMQNEGLLTRDPVGFSLTEEGKAAHGATQA